MFERFSFGFIGIHTKGNLYYKYGDTFGFIQNFMFRMFCSNIMLCWGLQHTSSPLPVILIFFCIFSFTVFWKFNQPTKNCAFINQKINLFLRSIHVSGNIFFETKYGYIILVYALHTCSSLALLLVRSIQVRRVGTYLTMMTFSNASIFWYAPKPNLQLWMPLEHRPDHRKEEIKICDTKTITATKVNAMEFVNVPSKAHPSKVAATSLWNFIFKLAHSTLDV